MKKMDMIKNVEQYTKRNRRRSIWKRIVSFMASIVVFCTTYALILPALTLEQATFCDHKEHTHSQDCYVQLNASSNLICTPEVHSHSIECIDQTGNVICGIADYIGHTHAEDCYDEFGNLLCTLLETVWHVHDDSCLVPAQPKLICGLREGDVHFHDDTCYTINVSIKENTTPAHTHGTECYDELGTLICELPEGENNAFEVVEEKVLNCTVTEGNGHSHTDACYMMPTSEFELGCSPYTVLGHVHSELCYDELGNVVCGMSENVAHIHDSVYCYDINGNLVCPFEETAQHVHTDECFANRKQPLTCELEENEEHTHDDMCYGTWVFVCAEEEHVHELACYSNPEADLETALDWEATLQNVELSGVWADDVVAIANSQIGYKESELNYHVAEDGVTALGYNRYGEWYGEPYEDWSAAFACFCLHYAGVEGISLNNDCFEWVLELSASWQNLYRNANEYEAQKGDLVFFDTNGDSVADRVGIVAEVIPATETAPATLLTIEGDSYNQVQYVSYQLTNSTIMGYAQLPAPVAEDYSYNFFDGVVEVSVEIPADSGVPADALLRVTPIDVTDADYADLLSSASAAVEGTVSRAQFYDISFYTSQLEYIPVSDSARVTMRFAEGVITPNLDNTVILHYEDSQSLPTVLDDVVITEEIVVSAETFTLNTQLIETTETVVSFETQGFSVFGVVEVSTETNPCELLEEELDKTPVSNAVNIKTYRLPTPLQWDAETDEKTVVIHFRGKVDPSVTAFRTWLCNSTYDTQSSSQKNHSVNPDGTFDIYCEYVFDERQGSNTEAGLIQFKGTSSGETTPLTGFELEHLGVFYGTLAEYEAERDKFGGSVGGNGSEVETKPGDVILGEDSIVITDGSFVISANQGFGEGDYSSFGIGEFNSFNITLSEIIEYAQNSDAVLHFEFTSDEQPSFKAQFNRINNVDNSSYIADVSVTFENGSGVASVSLNELYNKYVNNNNGDSSGIININVETTKTITVNQAWITIPSTAVEFEDDPHQIWDLDNVIIDNDNGALSEGRDVNGWTAFLTPYINSTAASEFKTALQTPGAKLKVTYTGGDGDNPIKPILQSNNDWGKGGTVSAESTTVIDGTDYKVSVFDCEELIANFLSQDIGTIEENIGNFTMTGKGVIYKIEIIQPPIEDVLFEDDEGLSVGTRYWNSFGIGEQTVVNDLIGQEITGYTLEDVKTLAQAAANGDDINLIIEFNTPEVIETDDNETAALMQTQFNGFGVDYNSFDKLVEVAPAVENLGNGNYRTTLNLKDAVDAFTAQGYTIEDITNLAVQLWCNNCLIHKVSFTMPQDVYDSLERDPVDNTLVTNLNGQIALIVAVNNKAGDSGENPAGATDYPAIASSISGNELIGANLDNATITDGKLVLTDDDRAYGSVAANRIVWQFEAVAGELGQYYIKASNYYNDSSIENEFVGKYLNITANGVTISDTPQAIEVVEVTPDSSDLVQVTENVVALRANVNGTVRYITLNNNYGGLNFTSEAADGNELASNLATHFVIADTTEEDILGLREDIDALPTTAEFVDIINAISVSGGEAGEKAGYDQRVAKREEIRAAAVAAKKLYDELVAEYAGKSQNEVALLKNLLGKERIDKLLELEWLYRDTPKLVNAVDVEVTVKMFNYDARINDHLFNTSTPIPAGYESSVGYKFYNASSNSGASNEYRYPGSWNTAKGQGEGSSPIFSQLLGSDGYPLILEVPAVIGKETNNEQDNYENVAVTNGSLGYLFDGSHQVGSEMTDGGGLFQQDSEGYYYYYSDTNAAYFNPVTNRFELYDVVTRPVYEDNSTKSYSIEALNDRLSNFLPFNEILEHYPDGSLKVVNGEHVPKVIYDYPENYDYIYSDDIDYSKESDDLYYVDHVTASAEGNAQVPTTYINDKVDLWFGMTLEYDFFIPQDGQTNGNDMIFEFHGDDDVLVYIDDVLVLDISGCHAAMDGHINFATGDVSYTNNNGTTVTTIQEVFANALGAEYNPNLFDGNTFRDYTIHDLKFFFLERGGSISYSGMRFNLPPIPDYNLMVAKELYHKTGNNKAESNEDFTFRVVKASAPNESLLPGFTPYDIYEDGIKVGTGVLDANGLFTIKAGQVAVFPKIEGDDLNHELYIVQELLTEEQDETYGQISYRTDGTPSGVLKGEGAQTATVSQVLMFYNNLLYGNARAGETTSLISGDVVLQTGGVYKISSGSLYGESETNDFTLSLEEIKSFIDKEYILSVNYTTEGWHNNFDVVIGYGDNQSKTFVFTDNSINLKDIKDFVGSDLSRINYFGLHVNSNKLTLTEAYFEVPTSSGGEEPEHTHTYSNWTSANETQHSRTCTSDGCDETQYENHTDSNSDNACDTCGYQMSNGSHTHNFSAWQYSDENQCYRKCQDQSCNYTEYANHVWNVTSHTDPTCTQQGRTEYRCTNCNQYKSVSVDPTGVHIFGDWQSVSDTQHKRVCSCGATEHADHSYVDGVCVCGHTNGSSGTEHTHSYTSSITTPATCTQQGVRTYSCSCGDSYTEAIDVDPNAHSTVYQSNENQHWQKCANCSYQTNAENHQYSGDYGLDANSHWKTCSTCGYKNSQAHVYTSTATNNNDGTHTIHCGNCDHDVVQPHAWNRGEVTAYPTTESAGTRVFTCTVTGCDATKTEEIPQLETTGEVEIGGTTYITYSTQALELNDMRNENYASTVVFENRLSTDPANLKITKIGDGINSEEEFNMQVLIGSGNIARASLSPLKQGTPYKIVEKDNENNVINGDAKVGANGMITLKVNQTAIIEGLAPGIFVEVVEVLGSGQNYTPTYSGEIISDVEPTNNSEIGNNGTAVIGSGDTVHITVENVRNEGKVIIPVTKTLKDMQGSAVTFNFKVEHGTWDDNTKTWTSKHAHDGTSIHFSVNWGDKTLTTTEDTHIVLGYNSQNITETNQSHYYKIYEQNAGGDYVYDDTFYIVEVYVDANYQAEIRSVKKNGTENVNFSFNNETDTLNEGVISFTNYTTAKLRISKTVVGADKSGEFIFNLVVHGNITEYLDENSSDYKFTVEGEVTTVEFTLQHGESIVFNLPNFANFEVKEIETLGCAPTNVVIQDNKVVEQDGTYGKANTKVLTTHPNYTTYVNYTNVRGCVLPKTGSALTSNLYIAGGLILLLAFSVVLLYNKTKCGKEAKASS